MKYIISTLFLLMGSISFAQDFYNMDSIQTIEVTFDESNWDALMEAQASGAGDYIMAREVSINGVVYDSVGVKYKGNSSYRANQVKNPWHIELNTYKDQEYAGYTDIKLANGYNDPSFLRDVLGFQILRQYMDAPLSNYANLSVNGTLIGLYTNTESVSKKFVKSRFGSKKNTFVECSPPDGADQTTTDLPSLVYLGQDSTDYYSAYSMKSDEGWQEFIDLCDTLQNNIADIEAILDVDRALWMLAFDNAIVNLDSYIGKFKQNYYLYRSDYQQFLPIVWDLNESYGVFSETGDGSLRNTTEKQKMDYLLHDADADYPLIKLLLSVPMYKRMYLAHYKTLLLENFDNGSYVTTGQDLQNVIDASVQADPNKLFTYSNFLSNLTSDVTSGGGPMATTTPGISTLMNTRSSYLLGLSDFTQTEPTISDIDLSNTSPLINETITVSVSITDGNAVYMAYKSESMAPFTRVEMYDDGMHDDDAAGDGVYASELDMTTSSIQYYIYAENDEAGIFSPRRAEYEYHEISTATTLPELSDLVINEFLASNESTVADQDDEYEDWIEFYNNGTSSIDLEGYYLSDDGTDLEQWAFPQGTLITAGGYLVVWADKDEEQDGLHANFKLSSSGESIYLTDLTGTIVDMVSYTEQSSDISWGRYLNGTGNFQVMSPTFNSENLEGQEITDISSPGSTLPEILAYPNPAHESFSLEISGDDQSERSVLIYSLSGTVIYQNTISKNLWISTADWSPGIYIVRVDDSFLKMVVN